MEDMTPSKLAGYTYELHIQLHERQIKWVSMDKTMKDEIRCVYVHMFFRHVRCLNAAHSEKNREPNCVFSLGVNLKYQVMAVPSKRRRIDGIHSSATGVGERLIEIEVLSISGECMLTLNVAGSMLGRELLEVDFG